MTLNGQPNIALLAIVQTFKLNVCSDYLCSLQVRLIPIATDGQPFLKVTIRYSHCTLGQSVPMILLI